MDVGFFTYQDHGNGIISALTPHKHRLFGREQRILAVKDASGMSVLNYDEIRDDEYKPLESLPYFGGDASALGRTRYHWVKMLNAEDWSRYLESLEAVDVLPVSQPEETAPQTGTYVPPPNAPGIDPAKLIALRTGRDTADYKERVVKTVNTNGGNP